MASRPWHRILAITAPAGDDSPESDFVAVLPAVLSAAGSGRAFAVGWLSRGAGAPLELITNTGTLPGAAPEPGSAESPGLLFPSGARGVVIGDDWRDELDRMVWTSCPGLEAPPLAEPGRPDAGAARPPDPVRIDPRDAHGPAVRLAGHRRADRSPDHRTPRSPSCARS